MIINDAQDTLFLGGETQTNKLFESDPVGVQLGMAASYSLTTNTYRWAKVYQDQDQKVQSITGVALNKAQTLLVLAGEVEASSTDNFLILFFLDPATGGRLSDTFKITTEKRLYLQSARSILLAGASRVYVTGRSWNDQKQYQEMCSGSPCYSSAVTSDYFQYFIFDYLTGTMFTSRYSHESSGFGQGTGASLLDVNRATATINGGEQVKLLGAHSQLGTNNKWVIGIYDINASTGDLSGIGIKYKGGSIFNQNGASYFDQSHSHQFADAFDQSASDKTKLYFTTTSRQQSAGYYGKASHLCIVTFDTASLTGSVSAECKKFSDGDDQRNQLFYLAMREIGGDFHIIYQNRQGLTGYYETDLWQHRNSAQLSKNLKPWAAVFAKTQAKEEFSYQGACLPLFGCSTVTHTFFRSYFAGQAQAFSSDDYKTLNSYTFGTNGGEKTAAAVDAVLKLDTSRDYEYGDYDFSTLTFAAYEFVYPNIETYSSLSTVKNHVSPQSVLYRAYDLNNGETLLDNLYNTFAGTYTLNTPTTISDKTLYLGDTNQYECGAPQFSLQESCDDEVKFLLSIDQKTLVTKSKSHFFTNNPETGYLEMQVLDQNATPATYEINYLGATPTGILEESTFKLTLIRGMPPDNYLPDDCKLVTNCFASQDTLTITSARFEATQNYRINSVMGSLTVAPMIKTAGLSCQISDIVYSMSAVAVGGQVDTQFIGFQPEQLNVTWQNTDNAMAGTYVITVTGKIIRDIGETIATSVFNLIVTALPCADSADGPLVVTAAAPTEYTYVIGGTSQVTYVTVGAMTVTGSQYCSSSDINENLQYENPASPGQFVDVASHPFLTFDNTTRVLSWAQATAYHNGTWKIKQTGTITRIEGSSQSEFTEIVLSIQSTCVESIDELELTAAAIYDQSYVVGSITGGKLSVPQFSVSQGTWCNPTNINYSFSNIGLTFVQFDATTRTFDWSAATELNTGDYTLNLKGQITRSQGTSAYFVLPIKLTIVCDCNHSTDALTIIKENQVPQQFYQLFSSTQSVLTAFTLAGKWCDNSDLSFTLSVSAAQFQSTEFITFNNSTMLVQWDTYDPSKVGNYFVNVEAQVTRLNGTTKSNYEFQLTVVPVPVEVNIPPILVKLQALVDKNNHYVIKAEDLSDRTYLDFGAIVDYNGDSIIVETLLVPSLFTFQNGLLAFDYQALMATRRRDQQVTYECRLTLTDSRGATTKYQVFFIVPIDESPLQEVLQSANSTNTTANKTQVYQSEYSFKGVIVGDNVTIDQDAAPPYWKSITTSNSGEVRIYFSEKMIKQSNISAIDDKILRVDLIASGAIDQQYLKYTWHVTQFTEAYITIQLKFSDPLYVSCTGRSNYDKIQITSEHSQFFLSQTSFKSIEPSHSISKELPPQLSNNKAETYALETITETAKTSSKTAAIGSFVLNVLLSASLQLLWGMINALQLIGHLPYFNVYMPASAQSFFSAVNELSELEIIPTDEIISWLLQDDSDSIFRQIGSLFLLFIVGVLLLGIMTLLRVCSERYDFVFDLRERIKNLIFWNGTLRYILEGYMVLSMSAILNVAQGLDWSTHFTRFTSLISLVILILVFLLPIQLTIFFRWKFTMFTDPEFLERFVDIIGDLSYRSKYSSCFILIYCYRRLAQICLIIFGAEFAWLQIQLQVVLGMLAVIIFGYISAHKFPRDRRIEYFNEVTIMMCVYHLFVFTDFVDDPVTRYYVGFSLIGVSCLNIIGNVSVMLWVTCKLLVFRVKKYVYTLRNKKVMKKIKKEMKNREIDQKFEKANKELAEMIANNQRNNDTSEQLDLNWQEFQQIQQNILFEMELGKISELGSELEQESEYSLNSSLQPRGHLKLQSERPPILERNNGLQSGRSPINQRKNGHNSVRQPLKQGNIGQEKLLDGHLLKTSDWQKEMEKELQRSERLVALLEERMKKHGRII